MQISALLLFAHTIYRAIEVVSGISGPVFQNQIAFMIANGALPLTVCILLSVFAPGAAFGRAWGPTSPRRRGKRSLRPLPLTSTTVRYAAEQSPRRVDSKQQTPTTGSTLPLQFATMATTVHQNPVTQTSAQPSPGAAPKNSPTFWREQRRLSGLSRKDSTSAPAHTSPKTSPTFEVGVVHSEQSPTFLGHQGQQQQQQLARSDGRRNSRPAQTPGSLVREDTLW